MQGLLIQRFFDMNHFPLIAKSLEEKLTIQRLHFTPFHILGGTDFLYTGVCPPQINFSLLQNFPLKTIPCPRILHKRYKITRCRSFWEQRELFTHSKSVQGFFRTKDVYGFLGIFVENRMRIQGGVIWVYWDFDMNCVVQQLAMAPKSKEKMELILQQNAGIHLQRKVHFPFMF